MNWKLIVIGSVLVPALSLCIPLITKDDAGVFALFVLLCVFAICAASYFLNCRLFLHGFLMGLIGTLLGTIGLAIESIFRPAVGIEDMAIGLAFISALPIAVFVGCSVWLAGMSWQRIQRRHIRSTNGASEEF